MTHSFHAALLCLLPLGAPAVAQQMAFDEMASFGTLDRYLNAGAETARFVSSFARTDRCRYTLGFGQSLDDGARRMSMTPVSFALLSPDETHQTYYDIGVGEVTLKLRDGAPDAVTDLTLTDPSGSQRAAYVEAYGATCDGDICTMKAPSRTVSFVVLGPNAQVNTEFVYLALLALAENCVLPDKQGN